MEIIMMKLTRGLLSVFFLFHLSTHCQTSVFRIADFGALGDGKTLNTTSIQKTIDQCAATGGGTVYVPAGVFLTGTFQLRSHVNLHLESGAVLKGSERLEDYHLNGNLVGLIFTQDAEDVAITGLGTIDGNGDLFMDLTKAKKIDSAGSAWTRQKGHFREVREGLGDGPVVPKDRPFQMIIFSDCRNVTLRDVTIKDSPFWTVHLADCDGVVVSGLRIRGNMLVPNNDGIDFTSCSNVEMSDCDIRTGDDCIVLTGYDHHFDLPGFKNLKHPSENITVTNCTLQSRSAAIRIGGFDQNPMRNYLFSNITITNSNRGIGIFARDKGSIENLVFSNIIIETRLHTGDWWGQGDPIHLSAVRLLKDVAPGTIRNVKFQNVLCKGESGIVVFGTEESVIEDVSFNNVSLHITASPLDAVAGGNFDLRPVLDPRLQIFSHDIPGLYAQYVKNLQIRDFDLSWDQVKAQYFTNGIEVGNFEGVRIEDFRGTAAPGNPEAFPISLHDGTGYEVVPESIEVSTKKVKDR
jgi:polygalacturonase